MSPSAAKVPGSRARGRRFALTTSRFQLGGASVLMLVLLRITIGWHFLYQGLWKLDHPDFSSEGFLSQAKGPLADYYHNLVPDWDGRLRLDPDRRDKSHSNMDRYLADFRDFYKLDERQYEAARQTAASRKTQMDTYLAQHDSEIRDWLADLKNLDAAKQEKSKWMPFAQRRIWEKQIELQAQSAVWRAELDRINEAFHEDLLRLLNEDQRKQGQLPLPLTQLDKVDRLITYSNIAIGACLIAGLFTRLASVGGALFLATIVLAQPDWPGLYPPPHPSAGRSLIVNKEFVEMMALFALATTRVGRWGGLDFFIHYLIVRPLFGKRQVS